jgi:hypothetical protein
MEAKLAAIAKFCAEHEGTFALGIGQKGGWSAMLNFGREAPDSPMAGGSAIGAGDTALEAIDGVISEAKIEVGPDPKGKPVDQPDGTIE